VPEECQDEVGWGAWGGLSVFTRVSDNAGGGGGVNNILFFLGVLVVGGVVKNKTK